jgi:hypothetical protein
MILDADYLPRLWIPRPQSPLPEPNLEGPEAPQLHRLLGQDRALTKFYLSSTTRNALYGVR